MSVTIQSAAQSILRFTDLQTLNFEKGNHPWCTFREEKQEGAAPNAPEEVAEFLGNELSDKSFGIVQILQEHGAKLGFSTGLNPCY